MNWNVQSVCCVGGIRLFWFTQRTNEQTHINKIQLTDTFFAFIYHHLLERVIWHKASTISTHIHTHIFPRLYCLTPVYLLRFIPFGRHMMTNAIQIAASVVDATELQLANFGRRAAWSGENWTIINKDNKLWEALRTEEKNYFVRLKMRLKERMS